MQIGFLSSCASSDDDLLKYDVTLDDEYHRQIYEILDHAVREHDQVVIHAILILIQVSINQERIMLASVLFYESTSPSAETLRVISEVGSC